jgi:uncharacterized membrane protein YgaE (UPF0421/DUF939 family)
MKFLRDFLQRPHVRYALLASIAVVSTYAIAMQLPWIDASVAALTALISVRPTFHDAIAESVRQVLGTILGALLGLSIVVLFGFNAVTMLALMLLVFAIARVLRLGQDGAAVIGVTMILTMGPLAKLDLIETRLAAIVLGALIALIASFWVRPGKPYTRAVAAAAQAEDQLAEILRDIAQHLTDHHGDVSEELARDIMVRSSDVVRDMETVRADAESAVKAARWSPTLDQDAAKEALQQVKIAQATAETVLNMSRTLQSAARHEESLPAAVARKLASVFSATADIVDGDSTDTATLQVIEQSRGAAVESIKTLDDTAPLLVGTGLLQDAQNLASKQRKSKAKNT